MVGHECGHGKCTFENNNFGAKCECQEGWTGKYCAEGEKSNLILYAAGESNFGETGLRSPFLGLFFLFFQKILHILRHWKFQFCHQLFQSLVSVHDEQQK